MAAVCLASAIVLRLVLATWLDATQAWLTFWPAVFLAAWFGGLRAGLVATALSILVVWYWLIAPPFMFGLDRHEVVGSIVFGACGGAFAFVAEFARRARDTQRRLTRASELARADAVAASRAKDEFLAVLGHELRNPLAPIATASALLRLRRAESRELDVIDRQVAHLSRLVYDLLDISRIARGHFELQREVVDLQAVVGRAIEMVSPQYAQKQQHIDVHVPRGITLEADLQRMVQVIANLLTNAIKFSPPGQSIQIIAMSSDSRVELKIVDQGVGMDAEMLARAFDAFAQGPQASDRASGGLGLGLAIARRIVELHGGELTATSGGLGTGTQVRLSVPLASRRKTPVLPVADPGPGTAVCERILVVDDNQDSAELMADLLRAEGHIVRVAFDASAALELLPHFEPTLGLLDIGLPGMDGYQLAQAMRARGISAPLIAITGYSQASDRRRAIASGFSEHLVKPVSASKLDDVVRQFGASSVHVA